MDWFKGQITGKPYIQWENLWFPVDFPLNQSIDQSLHKPPVLADLILPRAPAPRSLPIPVHRWRAMSPTIPCQFDRYPAPGLMMWKWSVALSENFFKWWRHHVFVCGICLSIKPRSRKWWSHWNPMVKQRFSTWWRHVVPGPLAKLDV